MSRREEILNAVEREDWMRLRAIALELDDEVERLTAACDDLKALADKWAVDSSKAEGKVGVMEAELERLRGALEAVLDGYDRMNLDPNDFDHETIALARAALHPGSQ